MDRKRLIPELNYWIGIVLRNTPVNEKFFKLPVEVDNYWKDQGTVLDLMFNETFVPIQPPSSSSSSSGCGDRWYVYCYRKVNLNLIPDPEILRRSTLFMGYLDVYAPVTLKYDDLFNLAAPIPSPNQYYSISDLESRANVSYDGEIYFSTNYHLWEDPQSIGEVPEGPEVIFESENIFDLTEEELMMLDKLFDFKSCLPVDIDDIEYEDLTSPLSKLIYIYLDVMINGNFDAYSGIEPLTDGSNLLHSIYEKHVLDMIYRMRSPSYAITYTGKVSIGAEVYNGCVGDLTDLISTSRNCIFLTAEQILNKSIYFEEEEVPYNEKDIYLVKDGIALKAGTDFFYELDQNDPEHPVGRIYWTDDSLFNVGDKIFYIWSYVNLRSFVHDLEE